MNNNAVNLFVIGNGFDLAHNLPTRYSDFKEFLKEKCDACRNVYDDKGQLKQKCPDLPGPQIHYIDKEGNGNVLADYKHEAAVLYWLIERAAKHKRNGIKDWADFEEVLMKMDFDSVNVKEEYDMHALRETVTDLSGMFFEWISKTVNIDEKLPMLTSICQVADVDSDIAINFNYTETLEKVYGFKQQNICYIHGKRTQNPPTEYEQQYMWSFGEGKTGLVVGGPEPKHPRKDPYITFRGDLIKNTEMAIFSNETFFERIKESNIHNVYSYGFSFSRVDLPYIRKICDKLNNRKVTWHIFIYDNKDRFKFICRLRKAGFKGKIRFANCKNDMDFNSLPIKKYIPILLKKIDFSQSLDANKKGVEKVYRRLNKEHQEFIYLYLTNNREIEQKIQDISKMIVLALPIVSMIISLTTISQGQFGPSAMMQYYEFIRENGVNYNVIETFSDSVRMYTGLNKACVILMVAIIISFWFDLFKGMNSNYNSKKIKALTEIITLLHDV